MQFWASSGDVRNVEKYMPMDNVTDYDAIKESLDGNLDYERKRYNRSKQKLEAAAMTDFLSNLILLAGYKRGARVSLATNNTAKQQGVHEQARERYTAALRDYKAKVADINLRQRIRQNTVATNNPLKPVGFVYPSGSSVSHPSLSNGTLKKAINDFRKNTN